MKSLWGRRILVLEDDYFLAQELERMFDVEGAVVLGPCSTLEKAGIIPFAEIDGAVLNLHVRDGTSYDFAHQLRERSVPFVFASGQDRLSEPKEWHDSEWVLKPIEAPQLIAALHRVMGLAG